MPLYLKVVLPIAGLILGIGRLDVGLTAEPGDEPILLVRGW